MFATKRQLLRNKKALGYSTVRIKADGHDGLVSVAFRCVAAVLQRQVPPSLTIPPFSSIASSMACAMYVVQAPLLCDSGNSAKHPYTDWFPVQTEWARPWHWTGKIVTRRG